MSSGPKALDEEIANLDAERESRIKAEPATVWINVTTFDGELIERVAILADETVKDFLYDLEDAVVRARR